MLYYDWRFAERIQCSIEDKRECFELILRLRKYASIIRERGFLALEEEIKRINDDFLAISLQMGIDGVDPQLFRDIQERRILVDNCIGKELLRRVIITEAMASILSEDTYMVFHYKLLSFLGEYGYRWARELQLDLIGKSTRMPRECQEDPQSTGWNPGSPPSQISGSPADPGRFPSPQTAPRR